MLHRVVFGEGDVGLDGRDAVGGQNLLGFDLGEEGAPGFAGGGKEGVRLLFVAADVRKL